MPEGIPLRESVDGTNIIKNWNVNTKKLLINWVQQIRINEMEHRYRGTLYKRLSQGFNGFGLITQTGVLTTMVGVIAETIGEKQVSRAIFIYISIVEVLSYITNIFTTFYDWAGISEKHFTGAKEYKALSLLIDATLMLDSTERGKAKDFITSVRKQFDTIAENSPDLPVNKMIHQLDASIVYDDPEEARGKKTEVKESPKTNTKYECRFRESLAQTVKTVNQMESAGGSTTNLADYMQYQWRRMEED